MVAEYVAVVAAARAESRQVARIFHPEPQESLVLAKNGSGIEVKEGPAGYQLSSGEVIAV